MNAVDSLVDDCVSWKKNGQFIVVGSRGRGGLGTEGEECHMLLAVDPLALGLSGQWSSRT